MANMTTWFITIRLTNGESKVACLRVRVHDAGKMIPDRGWNWEDGCCKISSALVATPGVIFEREIHISRKTRFDQNCIVVKEGPRYMATQADSFLKSDFVMFLGLDKVDIPAAVA